MTLQGEYVNIGKHTQHTFSSLVPGARYTVVLQGLNGTSGRSQHVTRRDVKTMETSMCKNNNNIVSFNFRTIGDTFHSDETM